MDGKNLVLEEAEASFTQAGEGRVCRQPSGSLLLRAVAFLSWAKLPSYRAVT